MIGRKHEVQEADFESVKSAILGDAMPPVNQSIQPSWKQKYNQNEVIPRELQEPSLDMPQEQDIRQPYSQSFGNTRPQEQQDDRHKWDRRDMYELFDRISVIEAQLTAIRSQTETINERLKMLDIKLTRRY